MKKNKARITIDFEVINDGRIAVNCKVTEGESESLNKMVNFIASNLSIGVNAAAKIYLQQETTNAIH